MEQKEKHLIKSSGAMPFFPDSVFGGKDIIQWIPI